jgi:hypothetical protein
VKEDDYPRDDEDFSSGRRLSEKNEDNSEVRK